MDRVILDLGIFFAIVSTVADKKQGEANQTKQQRNKAMSKKNKMIRVCEKYWLDKENNTSYVLVGLTWHSSLDAAKRYYSNRDETKKTELMWAEHGAGMPYIPLYPRLAKKS